MLLSCCSVHFLPFFCSSPFAIEILHLTTGDLGKTAAVGPVLALMLAIPTGAFVDRFGPKYVMAVGYLMAATASAGMFFFVRDFYSLLAMLTLFGVSRILCDLPMTPMVFQYASEKERGTVFGLIQFIRGFSAFVISLILGVIVEKFGSYSASYALCFGLCLVGGITSLMTRKGAYAEPAPAEGFEALV